jgi:hypothetical protein
VTNLFTGLKKPDCLFPFLVSVHAFNGVLRDMSKNDKEKIKKSVKYVVLQKSVKYVVQLIS